MGEEGEELREKSQKFGGHVFARTGRLLMPSSGSQK